MAQYCDRFRFSDTDNDSFEFWNGLRGPAGEPGPAGSPGPPGSSVELRGPVASTDELPETAPSSELWQVGTATPYDGWFYNGSEWENAGPITAGPPGPTGPTGPQGPAGAAAGFGTPTATIGTGTGTPSVSVSASGPNTAKVFAFTFNNLKGTAGSPGATGTTFTPSVSAEGVISWTNDGGKTNPTSRNIKGPQGDTGQTGPAGQSGEGIAVTVSGATPSITAEANHRYICGTLSELTFTPPASGVVDVLFTSGTTPTVLSLPNTVRMPEWFEVEAGYTYEINIVDGIYGAVMSWATA